MAWEIGFDSNWDRDIGYGVPAECDHPDCKEQIDRGLAYVCGGDPYGGEHGCGLFFCYAHLSYEDRVEPACADVEAHTEVVQLCGRCAAGGEPFEPKPDTAEWAHHKETDPSWAAWRDEQAAGHRGAHR